MLKNLNAGINYKIAAIAKKNGVWDKDLTNAIDVTPNAVAAKIYPEVTSIQYDEASHQFRLNWSAVEKAEMYGIAVKVAGKWKVQAYTDAKTTVFTSPKLKAGSKYDIVVCAKVNGKWDITDITGRSFKIIVK